MILRMKNRFKAREFLGPQCYGQATDYAKEWSEAVEGTICLWEPTDPDIESGPFFVSSWNEPWPDQAVQMVCAYIKGRNNPNLIYVLDDTEIQSRK